MKSSTTHSVTATQDSLPQMAGQVVNRVLTVMRGPPTPEEPVSTEDWAKRLEFETFDDPQLMRLVECCARFCLRLKHKMKPSWLALLGPCGVGKTHCARYAWSFAARLMEWHTTKYSPKHIYWPEFIEDLREGLTNGLYRDMRTWPVLFLDDIGAERDPSGFAAEKLNTTLGCRVGKWTIITSNKSLEDLATVDARIADRIIREPGNIYAEIDTESYGLRNRQQSK